MNLLEAVQKMPKADDDLTIYARQPWSPRAEAVLAIEGSEEEVEAKARGFEYFLEVFIAREFLDDWRPTQRKAPTDLECCERLIGYAVNDA